MWINNHTRLATGQGCKARLNLLGKKKPKWQVYQVYSHLYWETRLKAEFNPEYPLYIAGVPTGGKIQPLFGFRDCCLQKQLVDGTEAIKAEVDACCDKPMTHKEEEELDKMLKKVLPEDKYHKHN